MAKKKFFKSNLFKILLLLLLFAVILYFGSLLFDWGYRFRKRTLFLRITYMSIAVIWSVGTIAGLCHYFRFGKLWRGMMDDFYSHQDDFQRDIYKEYQVLLTKYPIAVAQFESKCWKQDPRPTNVEVMESALKISEAEWEEREKAAKEKMAQKHESKKS